MSRAAWSCDYCETNNGPSNDVCRNCGGERETAGGAVPEQVRAGRPRATPERPVFVDSKHATAPEEVARPASSRVRSTGARPAPVEPLPPVPELFAPAPEPPRLPSTPRPVPPRPVSPRPVSPRPSGGGRAARRVATWGVVALTGALVVGNWDSIVGSLPGGGSSSPPAASAGTPCPAEAARWLPDGGGAVLEAAYTTPKFTITLCWTAGGQLYYDGQVTGAPADTETHISIPAAPTATGYVAQNGTYRYEIAGAEVIVTHDGEYLSRESLTRTGP